MSTEVISENEYGKGYIDCIICPNCGKVYDGVNAVLDLIGEEKVCDTEYEVQCTECDTEFLVLLENIKTGEQVGSDDDYGQLFEILGVQTWVWNEDEDEDVL